MHNNSRRKFETILSEISHATSVIIIFVHIFQGKKSTKQLLTHRYLGYAICKWKLSWQKKSLNLKKKKTKLQSIIS